MKPGKLYIKIALSFLGVLFITLIVIFVLFVASPGKHFVTRLEQYTREKVLIVKEVVEDKIASAPTEDLANNKRLSDFIVTFGSILGAKVWLQEPDGTHVLKSFDGAIPIIIEEIKERKPHDFGGIKLYKRRNADFYAVIPIDFPKDRQGSIHVLFRKHEPHGPERGFAFGLFVIGLIVALLIIPISRFIIKPLKQLSQSALQIADGDLSHRARVKSKDEIGELCRSFNHMADRVEKMIKGGRELTAHVSHELRTPLARIRIAEELLREKLAAENYQDLVRHLNDIQEDIQELDQLIGRILDLSKLDIHETPFTLEPLNPAKLIEDLLDKLQPVVKHKRLQVSRDLSFDPPFAGDKEALHTAFLNILDNAAKFTPEQGQLIVQMHWQPDQLKVTVTNSFKALDEQVLAKIFEPFQRVEGTKTTGSGLGLAITQKIIEKHGGSIQARNAPEGFAIDITLPRKSNPNTTSETPS